ncbi:hypothetical protein C8J56DRAFT_1086206 [Mycena floridula]|nr:hypothetical protein C8J56DRAFT_1086206 [Mycena floridula]
MFMIIPHFWIIYCLASLTQGLTLSVPDNTYTGDAPVCTWMANDSDPSSFTLVLAMAPQGINPVKSIANAVERNGKSSGSQSFPAVVMAGPYNLGAFSSSSEPGVGGRILAMIQFQVTDPLITVRDQTSIAGSVTNTPHSAIVPSITSQPVSAATSQITGNGAPSSQDGPAISDALGGTVSMRSLKSDGTAGITITTDITIDSRTRSGPTALPSDISLRSKRINIGGLVGGIIAGVHRHTLTHPSVTVYDIAEDLDVQRQNLADGAQQRRISNPKVVCSSRFARVPKRAPGAGDRLAQLYHTSVRKVPTEIFREIFRYSLEGNPWSFKLPLDRRVNPWSLVHVSRRWRLIATSVPTLWNRFSVNNISACNPDSLALVLRASGSLPLDISVHDEEKTPITGDHPHLQLLLASSPRWRNVSLNFHHIEALASIQGQLDNLEDLSLYIGQRTTNEIQSRLTMSAEAPSLRYIDISGIDDILRCFEFPWSTIIKCEGAGGDEVIASSALQILSMSLNLREVTLSAAKPDGFSATLALSQRFPLNELYKIHIMDWVKGSIDDLFAHISTPALESLTISNEEWDPLELSCLAPFARSS